MSLVAAYGRAALAVFKRDLFVYLSYRARLPGQIIGGILAVSLLYYVSDLVRNPQFPSPEDFFVYALVGAIFLRALGGSLGGIGVEMRQELVAGTFERMVTSGMGATVGTAAMVLFPLTLAFFMGAVAIAFAVIAFGTQLEWSTVPLAIPAGLLATLTLVPFCLMIAAAVIVFKQPGAAVRMFIITVSILGGFLFPITLLPGWIQWAGDVQPFTPMVELLRHLLVGMSLPDPVAITVLKVIGFLAVLLPLSFLVLHRAIDVGRKRATLTEY